MKHSNIVSGLLIALLVACGSDSKDSAAPADGAGSFTKEPVPFAASRTDISKVSALGFIEGSSSSELRLNESSPSMVALDAEGKIIEGGLIQSGTEEVTIKTGFSKMLGNGITLVSLYYHNKDYKNSQGGQEITPFQQTYEASFVNKKGETVLLKKDCSGFILVNSKGEMDCLSKQISYNDFLEGGGIHIDNASNVYIDNAGTFKKISPDGDVTLLLSEGGDFVVNGLGMIAYKRGEDVRIMTPAGESKTLANAGEIQVLGDRILISDAVGNYNVYTDSLEATAMTMTDSVATDKGQVVTETLSADGARKIWRDGSMTEYNFAAGTAVRSQILPENLVIFAAAVREDLSIVYASNEGIFLSAANTALRLTQNAPELLVSGVDAYSMTLSRDGKVIFSGLDTSKSGNITGAIDLETKAIEKTSTELKITGIHAF